MALNNKRINFKGNISRYNFYVKKHLRELFLLFFSNLSEMEIQAQNHPLEETFPEMIQNFYNGLSMKLLFFVVFAAKILDMFVFPCYYFRGNGLYFKISTQKAKMLSLIHI